VALAEAVPMKSQDQRGFEELLGRALAIDVTKNPQARLENEIARARAHAGCCARVDELFVEDVKPAMMIPALVRTLALLGAGRSPASAGETKIRLATLAPRDSSIYRVLQEMGESWKSAPGGGLKLLIHADAAMGGEADVVKKMRVGSCRRPC
jgi:hypothetical protein